MDTQDDLAAQAREVEAAEGEASAAEAEAGKAPAAKLESQDDLGYITGEHDPKQAEKQVRTPAPKRQAGKAKGGRG